MVTSPEVTPGTWHTVVVTRRGAAFSVTLDGQPNPPSGNSSTVLPADTTATEDPGWQVAKGDPCVDQDGTETLTGDMANIFIGSPADAPAPTVTSPATATTTTKP